MVEALIWLQACEEALGKACAVRSGEIESRRFQLINVHDVSTNSWEDISRRYMSVAGSRNPMVVGTSDICDARDHSNAPRTSASGAPRSPIFPDQLEVIVTKPFVMPASSPAADLLKALRFAAEKHRDQRRKGAESAPYINHLIEVTEILARIGRVDDVGILQAAVLHDTIEDTDTTAGEIEAAFGPRVLSLVLDMTDDKNLPKDRRKQLQIDEAPSLCSEVKMIKLGDKISNARAITEAPPKDWPPERRRDYLDWAEKVVAGCRGCNPALEAEFDRTVAAGRGAMEGKG
jgi:hypothetical protein